MKKGGWHGLKFLLIMKQKPTRDDEVEADPSEHLDPGLIEVRAGLFITRFIHCYHHDQFRPKSGSGDQNKHIVPLVETVGWTATEVFTRFYS